MKKVAIIFFGNYIYDARIINMSHSLIKHKCSVSIIGLISDKKIMKNIPEVSILPVQLNCTGKSQNSKLQNLKLTNT